MRPIILRTAIDRLTFDADTGRLVSLAPKRAPEANLIASAPDHPVFALQYISDDGEYRYADSHNASSADVDCADSDGEQTLMLSFAGVGGMDVDVRLSIRAARDTPFSRWSCKLRNGAGIRVVDVQFPFIVVPQDGAVVVPAGHGGHLITGEALRGLPPDDPERWQFVPENGVVTHYPAQTFAQFLAWYNTDGAGLYVACEDTAGNIKRLDIVRREPGIRLGIAHVGDWPTDGERELEYEVVLRSFHGDWYDAADIYRKWSLTQKWATPLTKRTDIPKWLLDSPPHITIRLQGYVDDGPTPAIEEFLPYEKCVPLLENIARRVGAPLVAVLMSWERGGPWVYPDCFPPVGGDESLSRFTALARERGWHVGSFCNGTRWITWHSGNDYDGRAYFDEHEGEKGVCRTAKGERWKADWSWRRSYTCCMAQDLTKEIAADFVKRLIGWGMESIQFFDQNVHAATFPCFAHDHGHPPAPGKWMAKAMEEMIGAFRQLAAEAGEAGVIQSVECPCNEYCLPLFQQSDVRVSPPTSGQRDYIPLYHYLFHECMIMHGMMSTGGEPYALPIRNAWNCVWGEIPGAVMTGDGTLLNRETFNWAEWEPKVGSNDDALEMIRTVTALRRGPGRGFLVYGRMQRPARVEVELVGRDHDGHHYEVPAVAHAAWQAPDGRFGIVLANWTTETQTVTIAEPRLADRVAIHISGRTLERELLPVVDSQITVDLPCLNCLLMESRE